MVTIATKMKLSRRLDLIASMVPSNVPCADIGSDHGLLVNYLLDTNKVPFCYASDNKEGPYNRLKANLNKYISLDKVQVNLKDGIDGLDTDIYKTIIITGMGGDLICQILKDHEDIYKKSEYLLLGPHNNEKLLRRYLSENGYEIVDENVIFDIHYYEVILFKKASKTIKYSDFECEYGPVLTQKKQPALKDKYLYIIHSNNEIINNYNLSEKRRLQLEGFNKKHQAMIDKLFKN